jgi:hypothetical protein
MSSDQASASSNNAGNAAGHTFDNPMGMFPLKQQQMASPITGTLYSGPPAKYLNNTNNYVRPMMTTQKYMNYNGSVIQQQCRPNNTGVENATNDLVK